MVKKICQEVVSTGRPVSWDEVIGQEMVKHLVQEASGQRWILVSSR